MHDFRVDKHYEFMAEGPEFTVSTVTFRPGTPDTYWDPGDGPEMELRATVEVMRHSEEARRVATLYGESRDAIPLALFELEYALAELLPLDKAQEKLYEDVLEHASLAWSEREEPDGDDYFNDDWPDHY